MPLNGSGTFQAPASTWNPAVNSTTINSTDWAALLADITTALSTALFKDGQQTPTANIPMGGFKLTGLAAGSATGNSLRYEQLFTTSGVNLLGAINETITTVASATTPDIWTTVGNVVSYTGTVTATGFAAAPQAGARRLLICTGAALFTAGANMLFQGVASGTSYTATAGDLIEVVAVSTTQFRLALLPVAGIAGKQPSRQVLTSGTAATYTTPPNATRINIRMVGGGGGGAGSGTGGNGTDSTWSGGSLSAGGGTGGANGNVGGPAGTSANGDINLAGGSGTGAVAIPNRIDCGGCGGNSAFGGGGGGGAGSAGPSAGIAGATNTGGGGGGGGSTSTGTPGAGGGAGGYCEKLIISPATTYTYTVGAAGTAGSGAAQIAGGGAGGSGLIIVDEYYN